MTEQTGAWHMARFAEFAAAKATVGEPSPHMSVVLKMSQDVGLNERLWRAGCYLNPYSVLTGEVLWKTWPLSRILGEPEAFLPWLRENWAGIHTRQERRCVRTPEKFAKAQIGYAAWLAHEAPKAAVLTGTPEERYDGWWASASTVPFFGRYIVIRLLEYFRRCGFKAELYDIRSIGGWSPIRALQIMRPERAAEIDSGQALAVDLVARETMAMLPEPMTPYVFAALLCEYRVAWEKKHQYAGWTIDQELEFGEGKHARFWEERGFEFTIQQARADLFPEQTLGELHGWAGRRYDVAAVLADHGYVWSDLLYDYTASKTDLSKPVAA